MLPNCPTRAGVEDADTFVRPIYAGSIGHGTVRRPDQSDYGALQRSPLRRPPARAVPHRSKRCRRRRLSVTRFVNQNQPQSERPELTAARSSPRWSRYGPGRGSLLEEIADQLGAAVGGRAAVDHFTNDYQRSVRPARSSRPNLSPRVFPAPSSIWLDEAIARLSSPSTRTKRHRFFSVDRRLRHRRRFIIQGTTLMSAERERTSPIRLRVQP